MGERVINSVSTVQQEYLKNFIALHPYVIGVFAPAKPINYAGKETLPKGFFEKTHHNIAGIKY